MKTIKIMIPLIVLIISCSHIEALNLDFKSRIIRFCKEEELINKERKTAWGCFRYCTYWSRLRRNTTPNCKQWKTDYYDLTDPVIFKQFRDAGFVMIREDGID